MARKRVYTIEKHGALVLEQLANGKSLLAVCRMHGMPNPEVIYRWIREDDEFAKSYDRAKRDAVTALMEEALEISDDGRNDTYVDEKGRTRVDFDNIHRSKLRIETRKWYASKLLPKVYGDKVDVTTNGKDMPTPILGGLAKNPSPEEFDEDVRADDDD